MGNAEEAENSMGEGKTESPYWGEEEGVPPGLAAIGQ